MAKKDEQREAALKEISSYVLENGLGQTGVRQLASVAGISDRMLLYYFDSKDELIAAVLERIASELAVLLTGEGESDRLLAPADLLAETLALTQSPEVQPYMRVSIELAAFAARGEEPYRTVSAAILEGFLAWVEGRLDIEDATRRREIAAMMLVMVDGIALMNAWTEGGPGEIAAPQLPDLLKGLR